MFEITGLIDQIKNTKDLVPSVAVFGLATSLLVATQKKLQLNPLANGMVDNTQKARPIIKSPLLDVFQNPIEFLEIFDKIKNNQLRLTQANYSRIKLSEIEFILKEIDDLCLKYKYNRSDIQALIKSFYFKIGEHLENDDLDAIIAGFNVLKSQLLVNNYQYSAIRTGISGNIINI